MSNRRYSRQVVTVPDAVVEESSQFETRPFHPTEHPELLPGQTPIDTQHSNHTFSQVQSPTTPVRIQAQLIVGAAGDRYEQEADHVADQVLRMPTPTAEGAQSVAPVQVQRAGGGAGFAAGPDIERGITSERGRGSTLSHQTRSFMEPRFGASFGQVRIHTDAQADTLNRSISARAFTHGNDIFFRQGEYQPGSTAGQQLLAHELTHVVQQNGAGQRVQRDFVTDAPTDAKLFDMTPGTNEQPDLSAHTPAKKGNLAITGVEMQHFLERHTYKHQQLSADYRRFDATLWPIGTTVTHVLDGLKQVLKLMEGRTKKNKMVNQIYTVKMNGKDCQVQVGMIAGNVLKQFFPVSGAGTQTYTRAELAQIYAEKQKKPTPSVETPSVSTPEGSTTGEPVTNS